MTNQQTVISSTERESRSSKFPEWIKSLCVSVIVGLVVLAGQIFISPIVAKRVRIQESITQKRYEVCEKAIDLLQRRLASVEMTGKLVPKNYIPPEKNPPTQVEMNVTYTLLTVYGKTDEIAQYFYAATGPGKTKPSDIVEFVSAVRKELGVDNEGFTGDEFYYRILHPLSEDNQKNKETGKEDG